ncbi:hypothetical protein HZA39_02330 [Candidatus Peregrinibacteria bacterium]|nr:hypothetical protein [Candidatus Peregrinibacteria bacterium]
MENTHKNSFGLGLLHRIFNIYPHELPRVFTCWTVRLVYRMAFILSWTMILVMFVARFNVIGLPFLFISHAFLFIMGSFIYMRLIQKYHLDKIILFVVAAAILTLSAALIVQSFSFNLYLILMLLVEAFFLIQLTVAFDTFGERFFTPVESQRTFPLVESADTIAGIASGLIFIFFSSVVPIHMFTWIVFGLVCLMIPLMLHFRSFAQSTPGIKLFMHKDKSTLTKNIKNGMRLFKQHVFAKNLIYIILLQYAFLILVEYIYTGSVASYSSGYANVPDAAMGIENSVAHTFGIMQLIFSFAALFMQLSIGGKLIRTLGIIGSMILYPSVMLLNLAGLVMRFGFFTSALTKISSEITSVVSRNSYQASYYAFREEESEEIRQLIDGMIRPLGTMVGAILLILAQFFVPSTFLTLAIVCTMSVLILMDLAVISNTNTLYTNNAVAALLCKTEDIDERLKSADILMQKGHGNITHVFMKCLSNPEEPDLLRIKILKCISELDYFDALPEILSFVTHPKRDVRMTAIETIKSFQKNKYFDKNEFSKMKVLETFKSLFWKESDEDIRLMILNVIAGFTGQPATDFILDILQNESGLVLSEAIRSLRSFNDITLGEMLEDYLDSIDSRLVFSSTIALWQFTKYRPQIKKILERMIKSDKKTERLYGFYAIGEISIEDFKEKLASLFKREKDEYTKAHIGIALLKLGRNDCIHFLINILRDHSHPLSFKLIQLINEIPERYKNEINRYVYHAASYKIHEIFGKKANHKMSEMSKEELMQLRYCYNLLNSTSDILQIDAILKKRNLSSMPYIPSFATITISTND